MSQAVTELSGNAGGATYVSRVQTVCANGSVVRAFGAVVKITEKYKAITGTPSVFLVDVTGPYGGVGWLSGYQSVADFDADHTKLMADPSWAAYIDSIADC